MEHAVGHECVAVHCTTCCPSHQAYSRGWEDGKSFDMNSARMSLLDPNPRSLIILAVLLIIAIGVLMEVKRHAADV